jgi:hypothetical protein
MKALRVMFQECSYFIIEVVSGTLIDTIAIHHPYSIHYGKLQ